MKLNLDVKQGATFTKAVHWYGGGEVRKAISGATVGCITTLTVTGHGLPVGDTPVNIHDVRGLRALNGEDIVATYVDANTITVPISTLGKEYVAGSGYIQYQAVTEFLGDYSARMDIRVNLEDEDPILSLTDVAGITITEANAEIRITITDEQTAEFTMDEGVYDLEMVSASGVVTRLLEGKVFVSKEVTR